MQHTLEVYFKGTSEEMQEILVAELSELGCETFWNGEKGLRAYFPIMDFPALAIETIIKKYNLNAPRVQPTSSEVWSVSAADQYESLIIDEQLLVYDGIEKIETKYPYQIIVDPRLSFGSGHHPSTYLCLDKMLYMDLKGKAVLDLGCGSGILAVLAQKRGAKSIVAVDNNPWAIEISNKTFKANKTDQIQLLQSEISDLKRQTYEVILANLNASVIQVEIENIAPLIAENGKILLSGFMEKDLEQISELCNNAGITLAESSVKDGWVAVVGLRLMKK